jgi:hypothetical protein
VAGFDPKSVLFFIPKYLLAGFDPKSFKPQIFTYLTLSEFYNENNRVNNKMLRFYFQYFKPLKVAGFDPKSVLLFIPEYLLAGFAPKSDFFTPYL